MSASVSRSMASNEEDLILNPIETVVTVNMLSKLQGGGGEATNDTATDNSSAPTPTISAIRPPLLQGLSALKGGGGPENIDSPQGFTPEFIRQLKSEDAETAMYSFRSLEGDTLLQSTSSCNN